MGMKEFKHATLLDIQNVIGHFVEVVTPQKNVSTDLQMSLLPCNIFLGPMASWTDMEVVIIQFGHYAQWAWSCFWGLGPNV